jgi:hypothetical protein
VILSTSAGGDDGLVNTSTTFVLCSTSGGTLVVEDCGCLLLLLPTPSCVKEVTRSVAVFILDLGSNNSAFNS